MILSKKAKSKYRVTRKRSPPNKPTRHNQNGGVLIDMQQLLMTDRIFTAAETIKGSSIDRTPYLKEKGHQGFPLIRIQHILEANLNKLEAINIKPKIVNGKAVGRKIEGLSVPLYEIENGRHRVAKAIAEGRKFIEATIV